MEPMDSPSTVPADQTLLVSVEPAHPDRVVAAVAPTSPGELESALEEARAARAAWAASGPARSAALSALADELGARAPGLADLIAREVGKPIGEARGEVARAQGILRYYAQQALDADGLVFPSPDGVSTLSARRAPLGTVLLVCPWNFPLAIPIWKAAPALAYGNTVLLKPAGPAIGVAAELADCARAALPEGVLEVLFLRGRDLGAALDDPRVSGVSFTGSTSVGLGLVERLARRGAPVQAEMGGHNAAIVLEDADLAHAADLIVAGAATFAGQKCTATRRVVAVAAVRDRLVEQLRRRWSALAIGDPLDEGVAVGPVIDGAAVAEVDAAVAGAVAAGGEVLARGEVGEHGGWFAAPALIALDDPAAEANQVETFGPVLTVLGVAGAEEAVEVANATPYGLVGAVHGSDLGRAAAVAERLHCGMRRVNLATTGVDFYAPFGGAGASSYGPREQGQAAREFFTEWHTLTVAPVPAS
jgi:acyl-CoA reductase-like NAD-dependent aldehyde dehydrogenase